MTAPSRRRLVAPIAAAYGAGLATDVALGTLGVHWFAHNAGYIAFVAFLAVCGLCVWMGRPL